MLIQLQTALERARTFAQIDELARAFWGATGTGEIADADAERVGMQIEAARTRLRNALPAAARGAVPLAAFAKFPPHRRQRASPDRAASRARRRNLGLVNAMPHKLAIQFTEGERAVMTIIAGEVRAHGACELALEAIAARAGVCVTLARKAIRLAVGDGLLTSVERRRPGHASRTNVVRIVSREWTLWLVFRGRGCKILNPKDNRGLNTKHHVASADGRPKKGKIAKIAPNDAT